MHASGDCKTFDRCDARDRLTGAATDVRGCFNGRETVAKDQDGQRSHKEDSRRARRAHNEVHRSYGVSPIFSRLGGPIFPVSVL